MEIIILGIISASVIGAGVLWYLRRLKTRIKRFVLRGEKIEKYFKEEML
ncbi:MAG: hypothetical protein U9R34_04090 [Nanoarchaeota archaeon]|nr:hypothetical protein [Nanoarchaeota archaeon]MCK5629336.1 hypothetical protein [Nanoarchaeota archaeon]MEA3514630.1 hypothetical protein [Nanoarchaeota archaeon]